jgi:UrcA family protein
MSTTSTSIRIDIPRRLLIAFAVAAIALMSARAHAAGNDITLSTPEVKNLGRDFASGASIEQVTVSAHVRTDPATLTTKAGVRQLERRVRQAAIEACNAADPTTPDDGTCVQNAVRSAQAQVHAAVAHATNATNTVNG